MAALPSGQCEIPKTPFLPHTTHRRYGQVSVLPEQPLSTRGRQLPWGGLIQVFFPWQLFWLLLQVPCEVLAIIQLLPRTAADPPPGFSKDIGTVLTPGVVEKKGRLIRNVISSLRCLKKTLGLAYSQYL